MMGLWVGHRQFLFRLVSGVSPDFEEFSKSRALGMRSVLRKRSRYCRDTAHLRLSVQCCLPQLCCERRSVQELVVSVGVNLRL